MKLRKLKASSVRGIPKDWPDLSIGDRGLVVFGPNGVGKSSIVDALEFGVSGKTSLYPVRRQNVNWEAGAPHTRGGPSVVAVEASGKSGPVTLTPQAAPKGIADEDAEWITLARNASFVLRRHMLLSFITADPGGRYSLLEPFMNLGNFQGIEDRLGEWSNQLQNAHTVTQTAAVERAGRVRQAFSMEPGEAINEASLLERLNAVLREVGIPEIKTRKELEDRQAKIAGELGGADQNARLAALGALKNEVLRIGHAGDYGELLASLIAAIENLERETKKRTEAVLTDLLVLGKEAIEQAGLETCPLCEQDIDRKAVVARLNERIAADERITVARGLVAELRPELLNNVQALSQAMKLFIGHWQQHVPQAPPNAYGQTVALLDEMEAALRDDKAGSARMREFVPRLKACISDHTEIIGILDTMILREGGGERRIQLNSAASMIEALMTDWPNYVAAMNKVATASKRHAIIDRIHGHAIEARKQAVGQTLDEVAAKANGYYETIHPQEGIGASSLTVRDVGQGSVILSAEFDGNRENPMLHYSESHLDTLGLCYFLALRKHEATKAPAFKVMVLDDVMHSVDASHRIRIASLLKSEFADHQMIVTTHDLYFFEALRREFGTGGFTYGRINNWDLDRGPVFGDPLTDFDRIMVAEIREKLSEETLSAAGGRFFEWLLREATEAADVAVPARFKRGPEIGDLWPPLAKRLKKQKGFAAIHGKLIEGLDQNGWVRNACGGHYNPEAAPPTPGEAREFAKMLAGLYETLHCNDCGEFVSRQKDDVWGCSRGHLSYPAKAP